MDFLGCYIVFSPRNSRTPRGPPCVFDDTPSGRPVEDESQLEKLRKGDFGEIRKQRKMGERRKRTVQFAGATCPDDELLKPIALTPRAHGENSKPQVQGEIDAKNKPTQKDKRLSIFGIKLGKMNFHQ